MTSRQKTVNIKELNMLQQIIDFYYDNANS